MPHALFDGQNLKSITLRDTQAWQTFFGLGTDGPTADVMTLYDAVPWLFRGVTLRASSVAAIPYTFRVGDEDKEPDEVLGTTVPFDVDLPKLLYQFELWLTLYGRAYASKEVNGVRKATNLVPIMPDTVEPQWDSYELTGFKRKVDGREVTKAAYEYVYMWYPAAGAERGPGKAPAHVARGAAAALLNKEQMTRAFYKRGGIKPTLLSIAETTNNPDKDRLQGWLNRAVSGLTNAFKPVLWRGDAKAVEIGPDPDKLALRETTDMSREDIAAALGIPASLLAANAANYATAQQDVRTFHDWTVIPDAQLICAALNEQVFADYGVVLRERHDLMEMYQDDKSDEAYKLLALLKGGVISPNELRGMLDLGDMSTKEMVDILQFLGAVAIAQAPSAGMAPDPQADQAQIPATLEGTATPVKADTAGDLAKWQAKALRRFGEGKPEKGLEFASDAIPPTLAAAIRGALEVAQDEADIKAAFVWGAYP